MFLECKDLIKIYPSPIEGLTFPALRGLNLSLKKGELVSIIGPSGAGKSTLLQLIGGFDSPSSGEIWFDGKLVNKFSRQELANYQRDVGILKQEPRYNLVYGLNAINNVMLPMRYTNKFSNNIKERAKELLYCLGLKGKEYRKPPQLSGGEQQRVAIAVALANEPKILLADEPTGELDSFTTYEIIDYFRQINRDFGTTILAATHDKRFSKLSNITFKIQDGRLTTMQIQSGKRFKVAGEEAIVVDSYGNLRLPAVVIERFKGLSSVKVVIVDNEIRLIPYTNGEQS